MHQALKIVDRISLVFALIAVGLFVLLVLDMMYEVVARRVFDSPTLWAYDVAYMSNGAIFLLAAGYTLLHNEHIRIDFLSTRLPRKVQETANILAYLFLFWFLWYAAVGTVNEFAIAYETGELEPTSPWAPKIWPFYLGMMLGVCAFFLQCVAQCVKHALSLMGRAPSPLDVRGGDTTAEPV